MLRKCLILLLLTSLAGQARAQEVYHAVLESATKILNNPTSSFTQTRIAGFKRAALLYLYDKTLHGSALDEAQKVDLLNTQAYYLSEFLTAYQTELVQKTKKNSTKKAERLRLFIDASQSNPLWNDTDAEATQTYVDDPNELTPFSLDTDWQRAAAAIKAELKD